MMIKFKSEYAGQLLRLHVPNKRAYLFDEIGLSASAENLAHVDEAYAELVELGYVEPIHQHTVMPFSGSVPRSVFRLTEAGIEAKADLESESAH